VVDEGRLSRLLRDITDRTRRLWAAAATAEADRYDLWLDGVKYLFVTTIEGCVDVAQHVASSERYRAPDSNADAVRLLGAHGVIDNDLASDLGRAVGFRNVLVHQYAQVDDGIVVDALDQLDQFDAFVTQVSRWLNVKRGGGAGVG
jgi:uncharacterized protein YutE (UPF0331/DUF86 family)